MDSSGEETDTDVDSQPLEADVHRLLIIYPENEAACAAMFDLENKLDVQPSDAADNHHRSFVRVTSSSDPFT